MSKIVDLKKKLAAMKIKKSNSILLDIDYIEALLEEIETIETNVGDNRTDSENNVPKILHGGNFR